MTAPVRMGGRLAAMAGALIASCTWLTHVEMAAAQQAVPGAVLPPAFEVASVKPNDSGSQQSNIVATPGRLTATNVSVQQMISLWLSPGGPLPAGTIVDAPGWLRTTRYDITAKTDGEAMSDQVRQMMGALLADRFQLRLRRESRSTQAYSLTPARGDGLLGARLRRSAAVCSATPAPDVPGAVTPDSPPCQLRTFPGGLIGRGIAMDQLASAGLALEPTQDRSDVFIVEHVARPAPD